MAAITNLISWLGDRGIEWALLLDMMAFRAGWYFGKGDLKGLQRVKTEAPIEMERIYSQETFDPNFFRGSGIRKIRETLYCEIGVNPFKDPSIMDMEEAG